MSILDYKKRTDESVDSDNILPHIDNWKSFVHNGSDGISQQVQKALYPQ